MEQMKICPKCGKAGMRTSNVKEYHYRDSGLENVWLIGSGVLESVCEHCGARFITILKEEQLLQVIAMKLFMSPSYLRGREIRYLRETCRLTQARLAELLGKERRESISEWESQVNPVRDMAWEFTLRAILLSQFLRFLAVDENRHLTAHQVERLRKFSTGFVEELRRFSEAASRPSLKASSKLELVKSSKKSEWRVPKGLAA